MNVTELIGKTLTKVENLDDEILRFTCDDGRVFDLYHEQDCCESVGIEDVVGELSDLVGSPILMSEEASSSTDDPDDNKSHVDEWRDSFTWTFYKFATLKGYVTVRWYGESNGYYSESVDFREVK